MRRESKEETGLNVKVEQVFNAWTFIKADRGLQLVGIDFLCVTKQEEIRLSEEHQSFKWKSMEEIIGDRKYPDWLRETIKKADKIRKIYL